MSEPTTSLDGATPVATTSAFVTPATPVSVTPATPVIPVTSETGETCEIPEQDKPFILALVSGAITVLCIVLGIVSAWFSGNPAVADWATKAFEGTLPLTVMAWSWYFHSKSEVKAKS